MVRLFPLLLATFAVINPVTSSHHSHGEHHTHKNARSEDLLKARDITPATHRLFPRAQCSGTTPCPNGDCCNGESGFCGRDADYCNPKVCVSNCLAKAECGKGAETLGSTCPLNVCCGAWGYCGTLEAYCGTGCQSNCNQPAASGHNKGDVRKLVIGYWEAWSLTRRGCAGRSVDDIPVDSLTHLNVAFAYITPDTFEVVPMPKTSAKIFSEITAVKQKAPGLKIWISLGGWTFSDNDTDTQSVWGDIARTQANRNKFTVNLYKFMKTYGFDGVDIDWEYPGAPDRGGKPDDVQNFVLLMEYISVYFEASASGFGLSFTAPSSYWYLRWFKIDQLHKYVSWINVMTYDIHGSWDSPASTIGSIVYAHTNLTEIQDTLNLFWRNNVPADKLNLGIGFYGRSYTLEDSSCTKPGCPFSAPGRAGSCTGESGVLSYAEIEARIKMYDLDAIHDKTAGVKYLTFDENQWVSYDDQETLQTKVDFANEQGLLGLFVWAIDLDDTQHTALKALLGGKLGTFATQNGYDPNYSQDDDWDSVTGNSCTWSDCNKSCGPGTRSAGAEQYCGVDKDGKAQRETLCCPIDSTPDPKTCEWSGRGGGFECDSACDSSTVPIASSSEPYIGGSHQSCFFGFAQYCCKGVRYNNSCFFTY